MQRRGRAAPGSAPATATATAATAARRQGLSAWGRFLAGVLTALISVLVFAALLVGYLLVTRFGLGVNAPRDEAFERSTPLLPESALESVASLPVPPGNLAVSKTGDVYFSFHPFYNSANPTGIKVAVVAAADAADASAAPQAQASRFRPFPDAAFQKNLTSVLAVRIDSRNRLFLLDHCEMGFLCTPTLYAFELSEAAAQPSFVHRFPRYENVGSFLNDFQVSGDGQWVYITDTSIVGKTPALVVVDVQSNESHRLFSGSRWLFGSSLFVPFRHSGIVAPGLGPIGFTTHVDGISLSRDGETLYFSAVTSDRMLAASTASLLDLVRGRQRQRGGAGGEGESAREDGVFKVVSTRKPISDGQSNDAHDNIWLTAFGESALAVLQPAAQEGGERRLVKVVESGALLRWPDGLSFGPDGLYVTESALHLKLFGGGGAGGGAASFFETHGPFHIYRLSTASLQRAFGDDYAVPEHPGQ